MYSYFNKIDTLLALNMCLLIILWASNKNFIDYFQRNKAGQFLFWYFKGFVRDLRVIIHLWSGSLESLFAGLWLAGSSPSDPARPERLSDCIQGVSPLSSCSVSELGAVRRLEPDQAHRHQWQHELLLWPGPGPPGSGLQTLQHLHTRDELLLFWCPVLPATRPGATTSPQYESWQISFVRDLGHRAWQETPRWDALVVITDTDVLFGHKRVGGCRAEAGAHLTASADWCWTTLATALCLVPAQLRGMARGRQSMTSELTTTTKLQFNNSTF